MTPATILEHDGISQPILEWALDYGITPDIIIARLSRGMTVSDAITVPMVVANKGQRLPIFSLEQVPKRGRKPKGKPVVEPKAKPVVKPKARPVGKPKASPVMGKTYTHQGKTLTVAQWASITGLVKATIAWRLRRGWPLEQALSLTPSFGHRPGVVSDFGPSKGTGAGSTAQETPNLEFSKEAAE